MSANESSESYWRQKERQKTQVKEEVEQLFAFFNQKLTEEMLTVWVMALNHIPTSPENILHEVMRDLMYSSRVRPTISECKLAYTNWLNDHPEKYMDETPPEHCSVCAGHGWFDTWRIAPADWEVQERMEKDGVPAKKWPWQCAGVACGHCNNYKRTMPKKSKRMKADQVRNNREYNNGPRKRWVLEDPREIGSIYEYMYKPSRENAVHIAKKLGIRGLAQRAFPGQMPEQLNIPVREPGEEG